MASMLHDGLLLLFRNRPELAPELLRDALGLTLPAWTEARVESAELTEVVPTEYRADLVVLLLDGKPIFAIVVEVQLSRDEDKRKTWPLYLTSLRSRVSCPTALLVVTPDPAVARWCAQPIELGHPGFILRPLVMGPDSIPVVLDEQAVRNDPELAVLSAMAHGHEEVGASIAQTVMAALRDLDTERVRLYVDLAMSSLGEAARNALEALMQRGTYEYQSEFARKYVAQGREEGLQQGREEGRQAGRYEGEQAALLEVLDARGLQVDAETRQRIMACEDLSQLKRWLRKAVSVESVSALFEPDPVSEPAAAQASQHDLSPGASKPHSKR
jgi:hypothetical protein